ncbi:MAG: ATP-binding protein [Oscillospiraceae bacterium]
MKEKILGKFSFRYMLITALAYLSALIICCIIGILDEFPDFSAVIFDIAVIVTARYTEGFIYSVISALVGTVTVSYFFTYPYLNFDFSVAKATFTFILMLITAVMVGMLATEIKIHAREEAIIERKILRAELLRSLSHDLRTPLTTVEGAISAFLDNYDMLTDETRKHLASDAQEQVQCLTKMVENILTITKIEDTDTVNMKSEPIEETIGAAISKFSSKSSDISIKIDIPAEPLFVPMDSLLIEQVLINLMDNSVNHGENVTQINICAKKSEKNVLFRVSDNGSGIKPNAVNHLFEPMADYNDSDRFMGIGLSMCKSVIKLHGGEIKGYNDGGATFEFTLPLYGKSAKKLVSHA